MKPTLARATNTRVLLFFCLFLLLVQQSKGIAVEGNVSVQQGSVEGAVVHSIIDGHRLDVYKIDNRGKYKIELANNHKYELIFALKGNFSQKIVIETLVPDEVLKSNPKFTPIALNVNLFTEINGINISFVEKPIRKIYYNPLLDDFISDIYSDDTQMSRQIEQAVFRTQIIKNEMGFLSNLTPYELAEMKREYDRIIDRAGKIYDEALVLTTLNDDLGSNNGIINNKFFKIRNDEINEILGKILFTAELDKEQKDKYDDFIHDADNQFSQKRYTSARISYNRALSINPDDYYAKGQSDLIDDLLDKQMESEQYKYLIAHADNSFNELLYSEAAKDYSNALLLKPDEYYPKSKLEKINNILEKEYNDAEKSTSYKQTMKEAEAMYQKQFYEKSLASYVNALNLEPEDYQASQKIMEVKHEMTSLSDKLMYDRLIASADKLYRKEHYPEAMKEYFAASEIIPNNNYALIRINAINQKLELIEKFDDFISDANDQFVAEEYSESKENYLQALKIEASDKYAKSRIKEIDKILAETAKTNQKYKQEIAKADGLFNQDSYEKAKLAYTEAARIKPEESYPSEMNEKIDRLLSETAGFTSKSNEEQFPVAETFATAGKDQQSTIKAEKEIHHTETNIKADNLFKSNSDRAGIKEEIELRSVENDEELKNIYHQYVSRADELFDNKKYVESRKWYYKAYDVKPDENSTKQRIKDINQLLKEIPLTQPDKEYLQFVDLADSTFRENQYAVARGWYNRALAAKSNEQYPKDQLNEIENKIAERMAAQSGQQFETDVQKAEKAFKVKNYNVARFWYKKALELRPDNSEIKSRLLEITNATR